VNDTGIMLLNTMEFINIPLKSYNLNAGYLEQIITKDFTEKKDRNYSNQNLYFAK